jgi:hypothetical protein
MTLGEQLAELRYNILRDRSDLVAGDDDSLWSDETLLRYIGDAERRFARQTLMLRDSTTPDITQIRLRVGALGAGQQTYPLHPAVIAVLSAQYINEAGEPYDLARSGHAIIAAQTRVTDFSFDPYNPYPSALPPGNPMAFYTDETLVYARGARVTLSVYPMPAVPQNGQLLKLRVIRRPVCDYTKACLGNESEIPIDYQLDCLEWAAYRAQRTFDADAGANTTADQHKRAFDDAVTQAIRETKRKMFTGMSIAYGANGFTWTR